MRKLTDDLGMIKVYENENGSQEFEYDFAKMNEQVKKEIVSKPLVIDLDIFGNN